MAATTTVRVHVRTRDALARMAKERGVSTADLLAGLVERREHDEILEQMNASFARQRGDREDWAEELAEREVWAATLIDGLAEL